MSGNRYYAVSCPYGMRTKSDSDVVISFPSESERDSWVSADPSDTEPRRYAAGIDEVMRVYGANRIAMAEDIPWL